MSLRSVTAAASARPKARPHGFPASEELSRWMGQGWLDTAGPNYGAGGVTPPLESLAARRRRLSELFPGERLVVPAGTRHVRSNDVTYPFRPHSAFVWLSGLVDEGLADSVLVLEPERDQRREGHEPMLYMRGGIPREDEGFFSDHEHGEFWTGKTPSLVDTETLTGIQCRDIVGLKQHLERSVPSTRILGGRSDRDWTLATALADLRLVKDDWEIQQVQKAVGITMRGITDVAAALPHAAQRERGERYLEAIFDSRARLEGNGSASPVICAAGPHACTLHWTQNNGRVERGDMLLLDVGAEAMSLYSADVTRTFPVTGRFSGRQLEIYDAVFRAQEAAFSAVRPGAPFMDFHWAAVRVLSAALDEWGLTSKGTGLPVDAYRRWTITGGSGHMLGLDVHDCAQAPLRHYRDGVLREGMVLTVEPGLYFQADDALAPPEFRGIGVRLEDDVVVTADGCKVLSSDLPREPRALEEWMDATLKGASDS